jgi:hypothetical protein
MLLPDAVDVNAEGPDFLFVGQVPSGGKKPRGRDRLFMQNSKGDRKGANVSLT